MGDAPSSGRNAVWRLCTGVVVSEFGDWLLFIALPLYVLDASNSPLATSTVFLAELVPAGIYSNYQAMRQAERQLAEQAEASYTRMVQDWKAAAPRKAGASATPEHAYR
jgi:hypothetical protein